GMFVVGGALFETGMANRIGGLVTRFAKTERQLIIAIMGITGLLSGVLSNTGTAAILIPVVLGIAARSGFSRSRLLMPLVFAAAMGGNLTLIGAPGNLIAQTALQNIGKQFGFFEYAKVGLPLLVVGILYFVTIGHKLLPAHGSGGSSDQTDSTAPSSAPASSGADAPGHATATTPPVPAWKQQLSLAILIGTILGMIFEDAIGIPLHITACVGAVLIVLTGVLTEKQAYKAIDSQTIFIFGGTLSLATALEKTGAGAAVANYIMGMLGSSPSPVMLLIVIFGISCVLTNFMSNTATTALLVPIGLSIANNIGADPRAVLMAIVIGGSCAYATPIGMPANTMVLAPGGYRFMDYVRAGLPLILVAGLVCIPALLFFFPFFP
ncbi:MAG: SLC13 family permease, partial [Lautropia sp.]|nr:SLC13 family permease [Lautropia sp.]